MNGASQQKFNRGPEADPIKSLTSSQ